MARLAGSWLIAVYMEAVEERGEAEGGGRRNGRQEKETPIT